MAPATPTLSGDEKYEPYVHRGQLLDGRYLVEDILGVGGTSEVWRGLDQRLQRRVAVKVLQPDLRLEHMAARVEQEARAAAQLRHPAVVEIYDLGRVGNSYPYVVMEFLVGKTLKEAIEKRGHLQPADAVAALLPVADAVAAAHDYGIIHRDIKPENIFLSRSARDRIQPKLVDFGVARATQPPNHRLTIVGTLVGTPAYMAPEQTIGDSHITPAVDVWSLGVTLYEAVTGRMPFFGETLRELFSSVLTAPLSYPRDISGFDGQLFSILADATRKKAADRPTAAQFVQSLAAWAASHGVTEDLSGRAPSHYIEQAAELAPSTDPSPVPVPSSTKRAEP